MNYWLDIRLKIRDFFRKHKKKIVIVIIIWVIVIAVNYLLKNMEFEELTPITTYEPHSPVMDEGDKVPERYKQPINVLIENYVNYCNNKEYENAYSLLSNEYKTKFLNNIEDFKEYVNIKFATKKLYNIQNYSNIDNVYVYKVRFLEDILASGTTDGYSCDEEKIVIKLEDNILKLALDGYIGEKEIRIQAEDNYFKMKIIKKDVFYDRVRYKIELTNKTSNYIVLQDGTELSEVQLQITNEKRDLVTRYDSNIVMLPNQTKEITLIFEKFIEEDDNDIAIKLNAIRILPEFSGDINKAKEEKEKAIKLYSLTINLLPEN